MFKSKRFEESELRSYRNNQLGVPRAAPETMIRSYRSRSSEFTCLEKEEVKIRKYFFTSDEPNC